MDKFWKWPWGYGQNILILLGLVVNGFIIEYVTGVGGIKVPPFPLNLYAVLAFIGLSTAFFFLPFTKRAVNWVISFKLIITAVSFLGVLVIGSGFLPQGEGVVIPLALKRLGLHQITQSAPYALLILVICLSLVCAVLKRVRKYQKGDLPFVLNHLGLLVVILCGSFGSSDMKRLKMDLTVGQVAWMGYEKDPSQSVEMPFAFKLNKFELDLYPPQIAFVSAADHKVTKICPHVPLKFKPGMSYTCKQNGWEIEVKSVIESGFFVKDRYVSVNHTGAAPVIKVTAKKGSEVKTGEITPGSMMFAPASLDLDSSSYLAIPPQRPKKFLSHINYYTPEGKTGEFNVLVNKPFSLQGWKLYQYGYDDRMGKWSNTSIVEAIHDPWLPAVYVGIYMLIIGSVLMLFEKRKEDEVLS